MKTLEEIISDAEKKKVAIGHFNIANLEQLKAIAHVGARLNVPVIIGVSEGEREYLGVHHVRDLVKSYNDEHANPLAGGGFRLFLNADHTRSLEKVKEAAENGFDAILFDGSKLSFEENMAQTKEAVRIARAISASRRTDIIVEGELGYIGGASEIREGIPEGAAIKPEDLTKPEEAARFVAETGVGMLAPAVGNIHGMFASTPDPALDIARIRAIKDALRQAQGKPIPLVLHGASGNTDEDLRAAIDAGVSIIHISTELRAAWRKSLEEELKEHPGEVAPYKVMPDVLKAMEKVVERHLRLFNRL
ncbi:MAG: class II fructose-bisphosphate aldolase [Candidatus Jorgensenbacteria bacterium]|nr:class II fructose-bisphosphate aldolase [Candidatus Jorgensenbacteria bacterium]